LAQRASARPLPFPSTPAAPRLMLKLLVVVDESSHRTQGISFEEAAAPDS
jgi:hypothetical protein